MKIFWNIAIPILGVFLFTVVKDEFAYAGLIIAGIFILLLISINYTFYIQEVMKKREIEAKKKEYGYIKKITW